MRLLFFGLVLLLMVGIVTASDPWAGYIPANLSGTEPLTVQFTDISYASPTAWTWWFRNITPGNNTAIIFNTTQNPVQTFMRGNYSIWLESMNDYGSNTTPNLVFVNVSAATFAPVSNFTGNRTLLNTGEYVQFTDLSTNAPTNWTWSYQPDSLPGTGTVFSYAQNPQYPFTENDYGNVWTITLKTTNANGTSTFNRPNYITVRDITPPYNVTGLTMVSHTKTTILWSWTKPYYNHVNDTAKYMTYRDGVWLQNLSAATLSVLWTGLTENTAYVMGVRSVDIYDNANPYTVNATGSTIAIVPVADFTASNLHPTQTEVVTFTDTSTNAPTSWQWNFIGTNWSYHPTTRNVSLSFNGVGEYITVELTAANEGGSNTTTRIAYIHITGIPVIPVSSFTQDILTGPIPFTVHFTDLSTNTPTTWTWNFGDGGFSYTKNPTHVYTVAGTYSATVQACNAGGCNTSAGTIITPYTPAPTTVPTTAPITTATTAPYSTSAGYSPHMRNMAVTPLATVPIERLNNITEALFGGWNETNQTPNWEPVITNSVAVYTDFLGPVAFLLIFLIPFGMMWLAHGNMKLLSILGIIVGLFVNAYLPANYAAAAIICIVVAAATLVWSLFK